MRPIVVGTLLVLAGCPKSEEEKKPVPVASASAATAASSAPAASAPAATKPTAPAGEAQAFTGTYTLGPATLYIPSAKDWSSVKQGKDDTSKLIGDGNLSLAVDPTGRVTGTIDSGPGSPAVIDGNVVAGEVRGNVRRKEKDDGLAGTLVATIEGAAASGTLALSDATGAALRQGKLTLKKK